MFLKMCKRICVCVCVFLGFGWVGSSPSLPPTTGFFLLLFDGEDLKCGFFGFFFFFFFFLCWDLSLKKSSTFPGVTKCWCLPK